MDVRVRLCAAASLRRGSQPTTGGVAAAGSWSGCDAGLGSGLGSEAAAGSSLAPTKSANNRRT